MGDEVCTQQAAWVVWDILAGDERLRFSEEPVALEAQLRSFTAGELVAPKVWQDAYLAAFAQTLGVGVTTFDAGFRQFPKLRVTLLSC
jgi:predicted nucleic acid-binding protein